MKMKKIWSICLTVALTCGLLAGCGNNKKESNYSDDPDQEVTLVIAYPQAEQRDTDKVVAEINKKLETLLPNTKIELIMEGAFEQKWPLWMSTQKTIDLAHSGFATNIEDEVRKETYIPLNDLVDEYAPNIKKLMEEYWYSYDNSAVNGELYAIPNIQTHLKETLMLRVWNEGAEYFDFTSMWQEVQTSDRTSRRFWDIVTEGLTKAEAAGVNCKESVNLTIYEIAKRGYTFIGGDTSNLCYNNSDDAKIIDFYSTQEFKDFCDVMKIWADKGWVSKDILAGQWSDKLYSSTDTRFWTNAETGLWEADTAMTHVKIDLNKPENDVLTTAVGENMTYYSIPFTAANPARAMRFLDLINSEEGKVINNMLAYGIEGEHYEFTDKENGEIKAFEYEGQGGAGVSYGIPNWEVGNMLLQYQVYPYTREELDYANDYYLNRVDSMKKHVLYGYSFDITPVTAEMNKIIKNNVEYAESIYCGLMDNADTLLEELQQKNEAAGLKKVMDEFQKQADAYIASKK